MKAKLLSIVTAFTFVACANPVTQQEIAQAKFTPAPNQAAVDKEVNTYIQSEMKNLNLATKECSPPRTAWLRALTFEKPKFGWLVVCDMSAKEQSGNDGSLKAT